jgi:uncharacterized protein with HEPN domain
VSRHDASRLTDIVEAIEAIKDHLARGDLDDGLVYDAVRVRLIEIGEAVKGVTPELLETEPDIPWKAIARMRDHLAHRYFDTDHAIVQDVVDNELDPLLETAQSLSERVERHVDEP